MNCSDIKADGVIISAVRFSYMQTPDTGKRQSAFGTDTDNSMKSENFVFLFVSALACIIFAI